jgi:hypothetical protein
MFDILTGGTANNEMDKNIRANWHSGWEDKVDRLGEVWEPERAPEEIEARSRLGVVAATANTPQTMGRYEAVTCLVQSALTRSDIFMLGSEQHIPDSKPH